MAVAAGTTSVAVKVARWTSRILAGFAPGSKKEDGSSSSGRKAFIAVLSVILCLILILPGVIFLTIPLGVANAIAIGYSDNSGIKIKADAKGIGMEEVAYYQKVEKDFKAAMVSRFGEENTVMNQPNWRYFVVVDTMLYQNDTQKAKSKRTDTDKWILDALLVSYETRKVPTIEKVIDPDTEEEYETTVYEDVVFTIVTYPALKALFKDVEVIWEFVPGKKQVLEDDLKETLIDVYWSMLLSYTGDLTLGPGIPSYIIPPSALSDPVFATLIAEASKYIGYNYKYGGSTPDTSFDCSGYICWVYTQSGVHNLPRMTAQGIYFQCASVPYDKLRPGDLVFFHSTYDFYEYITHVGIYVGNDMMLHCGDPIGFASLKDPYWQSHYYSGGRLV